MFVYGFERIEDELRDVIAYCDARRSFVSITTDQVQVSKSHKFTEMRGLSRWKLILPGESEINEKQDVNWRRQEHKKHGEYI